jgi:surface polysaccharide O-acyltransferase-like enzyme
MLSFFQVSKQIFGVYLSLALVPQVVLHFNRFLSRPGTTVLHSFQSAIQSTVFLATFCSGYLFLIAGLQRPLLEYFKLKDHKMW